MASRARRLRAAANLLIHSERAISSSPPWRFSAALDQTGPKRLNGPTWRRACSANEPDVSRCRLTKSKRRTIRPS